MEKFIAILGMLQPIILVLVTAGLAVLRDIRQELRTINGKVISLEQWKRDRPCEFIKKALCPEDQR